MYSTCKTGLASGKPSVTEITENAFRIFSSNLTSWNNCEISHLNFVLLGGRGKETTFYLDSLIGITDDANEQTEHHVNEE